MGYEERDAHIIDYQKYELPGIKPYPGGGMFRGPAVLGPKYISCVGAAQTLGCFCEKPFPALLRERLGMETLNLGYGGAGPTFHNSNARLLHYVNASRLVIVQVLSGRSQSNSLFRVTDHARTGIRLQDGKEMTSDEFFSELLAHSPHLAAQIVEETRRNYVAAVQKLLRDIKPPKILFWFSIRSPDYAEDYNLPVSRLLGAFPQLVNRRMVDEIKTYSDAYVECVSRRGMPQPLFDKYGRPTTVGFKHGILDSAERRDTHNRYYPSPEMHEDATTALEALCRKYF